LPPPPAYRDRVEACNEVLARVLAERLSDREKVVDLLRESYERRGIEPLRGWSAYNLYDKEMALLYVLGKYGLGLDWSEYPYLSSVFWKEEAYERAYRDILAGVPVEEALRSRVGEASQEAVFRVLRLAVSLVVMGFEPEDNLAKAFHASMRDLEQYRHNFFTFMRFYVALRTAERIAMGEIRSRREKEAFKLSLCLRMGAQGMAPPDELIRLIARSVFKVSERRLSRVLS